MFTKMNTIYLNTLPHQIGDRGIVKTVALAEQDGSGYMEPVGSSRKNSTVGKQQGLLRPGQYFVMPQQRQNSLIIDQEHPLRRHSGVSVSALSSIKQMVTHTKQNSNSRKHSYEIVVPGVVDSNVEDELNDWKIHDDKNNLPSTPTKAALSAEKKKQHVSAISVLTGDYEMDIARDELSLGGGKTSLTVTLFSIFILLLKMIYINVAKRAMELFDCNYDPITGNSYFEPEPNRICYREWWMRMMPYGVAAVGAYVVGIPLLFLFLFLKRRKYLYIPLNKRTRLQQFIVQITYKKNSEFREEVEHWNVVLLVRSFLIICCMLFFGQSVPFQAVMLIIFFLLFFGGHVRVYPYKIPTLNMLEGITTFSSMLVLLCGLMFYVQQFRASAQIKALSYSVIAIIALTTLLIFIVLLKHLYYMYRDYKTKKAGNTKSAKEVKE
jgi:uncharacterized membrane protein